MCRRCLVSGVWCVDGVWCLVSGGVLPLMKPPFWWVLSYAKFGSVVLWEGPHDPPVWAVAKTAAGAGLLLVGGTAAEPRLNGGRPPHGGKKVASFLPKIHSNLLKILPEKFPLRPVSVDHPNLVYINCTPTTVTPGDCTHASECTRKSYNINGSQIFPTHECNSQQYHLCKLHIRANIQT